MKNDSEKKKCKQKKIKKTQLYTVVGLNYALKLLS